MVVPTLAVFLLATAEIAPGVVLVPGQLQKDRSPDGNSVLLRGTEGWVVVDTGRGGAHTDEVLAWLGYTREEAERLGAAGVTRPRAGQKEEVA